jgi:hypothetical protein
VKARRATGLPDQSLAEFVADRSRKNCPEHRARDRQSQQCLRRLKQLGVVTLRQLIGSLLTLPPSLQSFGIWQLGRCGCLAAESVLLQLLQANREPRMDCAVALGFIAGRRSARALLQIGRQQMSSDTPDCKWLDAAIHVLKWSDLVECQDLVLRIYERTDLPGWLRGNAGDALGSCCRVSDRRTTMFRRAIDAAFQGLADPDIETQFWSMYIIGMLADASSSGCQRSNDVFQRFLPRLRKIAASDHRMSPGYWWPMSAEAEDVMSVIQSGRWPEQDAGDRWRRSDGNP